MLIPKLFDNFPTSPLTDPLYRFIGTNTYNGTFDRVETSGTSSGIEILNSNHSTGSLEVDADWFPDTNSGLEGAAVRAFGYLFVTMYFRVYIFPDTNEDWVLHGDSGAIWFNGTNLAGTRRPALAYRSKALRGTRARMKIVATNYGTDFYIDDILYMTAPPRQSSHNAKIFMTSNAGFTIRTYSIDLKTDSALPTAPTILAPAEAGTINAAQEITVQIPESRLYVDLGSYAPSITGLTNVFYDPSGANVAMAEDTGIPDRAGGTNGDYYLEIPSNGVAHDYRLVVKEEFVTANSVVTTDDIDFDVSPSPAAQNGTITEDDDLHCYLNVFSNVSSGKGESSLNALGKVPLFHNTNADGNLTNINSGGYDSVFDFSADSIFSYNSSIVFPVILDIDLGRIYHIKRINTIQHLSNGTIFTGFDLYSKTTPFSGAGVQGTLEYTNYPISITSNAFFDTPEVFVQAPTLDFYSRYLRIYAPNSGYLNVGVAGYNYWPYDFDIQVADNETINSDDDNAQFEHDSGAGYVAFPAGGVTQGDGFVRITLPLALQVASGDRVFASVQFNADLTD